MQKRETGKVYEPGKLALGQLFDVLFVTPIKPYHALPHTSLTSRDSVICFFNFIWHIMPVARLLGQQSCMHRASIIPHPKGTLLTETEKGGIRDIVRKGPGSSGLPACRCRSS